jgi:hypothetical protein
VLNNVLRRAGRLSRAAARGSRRFPCRRRPQQRPECSPARRAIQNGSIRNPGGGKGEKLVALSPVGRRSTATNQCGALPVQRPRRANGGAKLKLSDSLRFDEKRGADLGALFFRVFLLGDRRLKPFGRKTHVGDGSSPSCSFVWSCRRQRRTDTVRHDGKGRRHRSFGFRPIDAIERTHEKDKSRDEKEKLERCERSHVFAGWRP